MDLEEFIDIQGYEGKYKINKNGDILNVKRNNILKPNLHKDGYYKIGLFKDNKKKDFLIHRLIALHFIDNPDNLPVIDHKDRNKTNNNIENLRWSSVSDNNKNRTIKAKGCIFLFDDKRRKNEKPYYTVRIRTKYLGSFKTYEEAEECLKKYLEENEN